MMNSYMPYKEMLLKREWFDKCHSVLVRDKCSCRKCGSLGYHRDLLYVCNDICEVDLLFRDSTINGKSVSDFFLSYINNESGFRHTKGYVQTQRKEHNGYYSYEINPFPLNNDKLVVIPRTTLLFDINDGLKTSNISLWYSCFGADTRTSFRAGLDTHFAKGVICRFEFEMTNKCIISIENMYPAGAMIIGNNVELFACIVVTLTYKQYCMSLYLYTERFYEDYELTKNLDKSIKAKGLNIHHQYYVKGKFPWEYDDDALVTLCEDCHKKLHENNSTPVYRCNVIPSDIIEYAKLCDKCGGSGYLPQYDYYMGGVCFKCWGEGVILP